MISGGLVTLFVDDVGTSVRFYIETLGMKLVAEAGQARAVIDAGDGFRIALERGTPPSPAPRTDSSITTPRSVPAAPSSSIGLFPKVPLREAVAIFENRGIAFEIVDEAARTLARFRDPDGNSLYLVQDK